MSAITRPPAVESRKRPAGSPFAESVGRRGHCESFALRHHLIVVLAYLALLNLISFGGVVGKVGFYLDDWLMLSQLHFGPQPLLDMIAGYFLGDPRIIVRPVEILHFVPMYLAFGLKPLGYHLVNGTMEVLTALLLYLAVWRLSANRLLSLFAAALFLLYPNHDSTHYWVVASSATLSLLLFAGSFLLHMESVLRGKPVLAFGAYACFALSILNYECFLPLFPLNVMAGAWVLARRGHQIAWPVPICRANCSSGALPATSDAQKQAAPPLGQSKEALPAALSTPYHAPGQASQCISWRWWVANTAPYLGAVAFTVLYGRFLAPMLGTAWIHAAEVSPAGILGAVKKGFQVTVGPTAWQFFWSQAECDGSWNTPAFWILAAAVALVTLPLAALFKGPAAGGSSVLFAAAAGIFIIILSYTIFGLNSEYEPVLHTIVNRINYGGSIGGALICASACLLLGRLMPVSRRSRWANAVHFTISAALLVALLSFFIATNWALSRPWTLSWMMQKHVQKVLKENEHLFHSGDAVMLLNAPRYVYWSPVYDGTWDFQSTLRLTLGTEHILGGVVSERLQASRSGLVDAPRGYVIGRYPFERMHAVIATESRVIPVASAAEFFDVVEASGMGFGLERAALERWRLEAGCKPR